MLDAIAAELGTSGSAQATCTRPAGSWAGCLRSRTPGRRRGHRHPSPAPQLGRGQARLATWDQLIDLGGLTDGDELSLGTARPPVVRLSKARAHLIIRTYNLTETQLNLCQKGV